MNNKKKDVQQNFRRRLGLRVDKPKPGYGTQNIEISAEVTVVHKNQIYRFYRIHLALSSTTATIDTNKLKTAKIHKILFHGYSIIEHAIVPIGSLSEKAQESRNKNIKNYRERFARKMSRTKTMEDVVHNLLISSDPYITNLTIHSPALQFL